MKVDPDPQNLLQFRIPDNDRRQSGFSLAEVSVVLLIAFFILILTIPLYRQISGRSSIQNEAIALATRLEIAESLAKSGQSSPQQITQFRIRFTSSGYVPEMYNTSGSP